MGLPSVSRIGASPLWRAGLAIVFILGLAGFAAGVIPQACKSGAVDCDGSAALESPLVPVTVESLTADTDDGLGGPSPASQGEAPSPLRGEGTEAPVQVASATSLANREPAALTSNDLIAATFDMLETGLVTTPGELSSRKVKTVTVGADGQPVGDSAGTTAEVAPLVPEEPAEVAAAPVSEEEPVEEPPAASPQVEQPSSEPVQVAEVPDEVEVEDVGATAYAPVAKGNAVIKGQGVNVRSNPRKGQNEVLFTLAGGEEVTVVEMSNGWAKIVDSRGRSGWAYGDYLRR